MAEFVRWLSNQTGSSIVVSRSLDDVPVTIEVVNQTPDEVLGVVARRAGVQVTRSGNLYFLGDLRREDRGVLVRRVRRLASEDIQAAVDTLRSEYGSSAAFADGLLVMGDRVEVLTRINELLDQVEQAESPTWVVQMYLISLSKTEIADLGFDATPAADVSLAFASNSHTGLAGASALGASAKLKGGLDALLRFARSRSGETLFAQPLFYLADGASAEMVRGDRVPVPRQTVSDQGTVTTAGFEFVQTGLQLSVRLREVTESAAALDADLSLSSVTGFVQAAPITTQETFKTRAIVASGGVYLLGSIERSDLKRSDAVGLKVGDAATAEARTLQVWARAVRVGGPALQGGRDAAGEGPAGQVSKVEEPSPDAS